MSTDPEVQRLLAETNVLVTEARNLVRDLQQTLRQARGVEVIEIHVAEQEEPVALIHIPATA